MVNLRSIPLRPRQECVAGKQYYRCASPQFQGCCSVDACASNGCPDDDTSTTNGSGNTGSDTTGGARTSTTTTSRPTSTSTTSRATTSTRSSTTTSSPATVTVTNARLTTIVSTAPGGLVTTTTTSIPVNEQQPSSSSSILGPVLGAVFGLVGLGLVLGAIYFCCWRPRRKERRRRHMHNIYSKAGTQPYVSDLNDQEEGTDSSVKERGSGFWSIFSNKVYKPLRESKTRRLTTASEASWLNPPQPSPSATTTSPYSPDSIRQPPISPELDDTSTRANLTSRPIIRPTRLSELPGSSPELLSSSSPTPPPFYPAELPADEGATVKARALSPLPKSHKKDRIRALHHKPKTNDDGGGDEEEEESMKRQTLLISPTLPEHDRPLLPSSPMQAHHAPVKTRSDTQPIITINGMGIDLGTGTSMPSSLDGPKRGASP
ncbi:MAG: hypothetical protein M1816_001134 [Peltula sp. TS41687]|nr:MAG: hypothetical protein M1816_001134 [Peltula sp. TS41687]